MTARDYANEVPPTKCVKDCLKLIGRAPTLGTIDKFIEKYNELGKLWEGPGYSWEEGKKILQVERNRLEILKAKLAKEKEEARKAKEEEELEEAPF